MKWDEIRINYPQQWILAEAIQATSQAGKRIISDLAVIGTFPDSVAAMKRYSQIHHDMPDRELYVLHTSREQLDITERFRLPIRPAI